METEIKKNRISFHFHPDRANLSSHAVEKDDNGKKRRYLEGISSGPKLDGHGERMTANAINSFMEQANKGDILLYSGKHGVDFTDDIGILSKAWVDPATGDWHTSYRLYDEADGVGANKAETIDTIWRQINGLAPYSTPKQKGFSVEGVLEEGSIVSQDGSGRRVLDNVQLDGVVLVNRPAYKFSVVGAVYKALGIPGPWDIRKTLIGTIEAKVAEAESRSLYYDKKFRYEEALCEETRKIVEANPLDIRSRLEELYDEYASLMVELVMENANVFAGESSVTAGDNGLVDGRTQLIVQIQDELRRLVMQRQT